MNDKELEQAWYDCGLGHEWDVPLPGDFIRLYRFIETKTQMKPLSGDEIVKAYNQTPVTARVACFEAGVRFAEKHHKIGGEDE